MGLFSGPKMPAPPPPPPPPPAPATIADPAAMSGVGNAEAAGKDAFANTLLTSEGGASNPNRTRNALSAKRTNAARSLIGG